MFEFMTQVRGGIDFCIFLSHILLFQKHDKHLFYTVSTVPTALSLADTSIAISVMSVN